MSDFIPNAVSLLSVMSNTVDMIRVEKYFSQLVRTDKLSRPDTQSSRVETRSTRTDAKEQAPYILYASFYKQWSHMTYAKEQARYTLYNNIHCSLNKAPT